MLPWLIQKTHETFLYSLYTEIVYRRILISETRGTMYLCILWCLSMWSNLLSKILEVLFLFKMYALLGFRTGAVTFPLNSRCLLHAAFNNSLCFEKKRTVLALKKHVHFKCCTL